MGSASPSVISGDDSAWWCHGVCSSFSPEHFSHYGITWGTSREIGNVSVLPLIVEQCPGADASLWDSPWPWQCAARLEKPWISRVFHDSCFSPVATHSSVLAWRIPGTGEPGGLLSMGSHRVGHDWSDLAAAAFPQTTTAWWSHSPRCMCLAAHVWERDGVPPVPPKRLTLGPTTPHFHSPYHFFLLWSLSFSLAPNASPAQKFCPHFSFCFWGLKSETVFFLFFVFIPLHIFTSLIRIIDPFKWTDPKE